MKKSVFSAAKLAGLTAVNRGTKSSNDIRPAITTARGMNKFTMNASASALIGCGHGDRVVMFAMPNADSINERFFIALSAGSEGCKLASAGNTKGTGRPQSFNYAGVWSQMLMQDKDAAPVGERVLADKGLMEEVETQTVRCVLLFLLPSELSMVLRKLRTRMVTLFLFRLMIPFMRRSMYW